MARLNIEDSLFKDPRFMNLCIRLGCQYKALGALVLAWSLAQKWYKTPEKMIPKSEWENHGFPQGIIECGLAEVVGEKIKMRGADEQFQWLAQRIEAGRKGGLKSQGNLASDRQANASKRKPPTLTPSLSLSLSQAHSQKKKKAESVPAELSSAPVPGLESLESVFQERNVSSKLQATWLNAFPDPSWICSEIRKALAWEAANPNRKKKNFGAFMTRWMTSGWDKRRYEPHKKSILEMFSEGDKKL